MSKTIWIVNYYTGTPENVSNPRYIKLAAHFMNAGYNVITFNHTFEGEDSFQRKQYGEYKFIHIKSPYYVGNGLKRMYSIWKFAHLLKKNCKCFEKPDVILHNIHPPFDYPIARIAKILNVNYITEAWDLWPEGFVRFGLISNKNPLIKIAYRIERKFYYSADKIVFTMKGAIDYITDKGWTKEGGGKIDLNDVHYINNGIDIEQFDLDVVNHPRNDKDLINPETIKIIYLGSINLANNVQTLLDAARSLLVYPKYKFIFYGDGAHRAMLEKKVREEGITNVVFKEKRITFAECAWIVSQATVNVMNYSNAFGKYGASSGKMFLYLAAGKPILCNVNIAYDNIITENKLGISRDINTAEEFASAIRKLAEQPKEEYDAMCSRVREVAKQFDYKVLAQKELAVIDSLYK